MDTKLTWYGHATWLLETAGKRVLIDPFLNDNPSAPLKSRDVDADHILITHGHFDHVADAAEIANRCKATLVANFEIANWFESKFEVQNTIGMNLGGSVHLPFGKVTMTIAFHSSQLPDGSYGGNPGGFLLELDALRIYVAGDTALFSDMQLIGREPIDVAILPIGDLFTMGPGDSVAATQLLKPKNVLPAHYKHLASHRTRCHRVGRGDSQQNLSGTHFGRSWKGDCAVMASSQGQLFPDDSAEPPFLNVAKVGEIMEGEGKAFTVGKQMVAVFSPSRSVLRHRRFFAPIKVRL
jgi:L-ascorbate metabolism protein UlaG (beta-lactamase superfamily)